MKIKKQSVEPEITPASLPDIAFLLLIFFIATTIFETERGIPLILPPAGKTSPVKVNRKNVLIINSDANNKIYMDDEPVAVSEIAHRVEQRLEENDKLIVSIESHPESEYQTMVTILDEVKKAKATRISVKLFTG